MFTNPSLLVSHTYTPTYVSGVAEYTVKVNSAPTSTLGFSALWWGNNLDYAKWRDIITEVTEFGTTIGGVADNLYNQTSKLDSFTASYPFYHITGIDNFFSQSTISSITGESNMNPIRCDSLDNVFSSVDNITELDLGDWDFSNIRYINRTFYDMQSLENITWPAEVNLIKTSRLLSFVQANPNLTRISIPFINTHSLYEISGNLCSGASLTELDLGDLTTKNAATLSAAFANCSALDLLDLSFLDLTRASNISNLFGSTSSNGPLNLDLSHLDFSRVKNMDYMFKNASLESIDFGDIDTSRVTSMKELFNGTTVSIISGIENFNTESVLHFDSMFRDFDISPLNLENISTQSAISADSMFNGATTNASLDLSNFNWSGLWDFDNFLTNASGLTEVDLGDASSFLDYEVEDETDFINNFLPDGFETTGTVYCDGVDVINSYNSTLTQDVVYPCTSD